MDTADKVHNLRMMLGFYGFEGGYEPGHFVTRLITAMIYADKGNMERLRLGFPEYVEAFEYVREHTADEVRAQIERLELRA